MLASYLSHEESENLFIISILGVSVHQSYANNPSELEEEIWCMGSPGGHVCPKGILPHCLYGFPKWPIKYSDFLLFLLYLWPFKASYIIQQLQLSLFYKISCTTYSKQQFCGIKLLWFSWIVDKLWKFYLPISVALLLYRKTLAYNII